MGPATQGAPVKNNCVRNISSVRNNGEFFHKIYTFFMGGITPYI